MLSSGDSSYYAWDAAAQTISAEPTAGTVSFTYNADGQRVVKQDTDGSATGFLYDFSRLLHETDEVGGQINNTYAVSTQDEFGDLLSEDGEQLTHQYDAMIGDLFSSSRRRTPAKPKAK